jgi:hypothetical protein
VSTRGHLVKIDEKFHAVSPAVAEEISRLRKELHEAQVITGLVLAPDQQYYAGTPVHQFMREMDQLRDFRERVEKVLADNIEYYEWSDAIERVDRIRKLLVPLLAELKSNQERS